MGCRRRSHLGQICDILTPVRNYLLPHRLPFELYASVDAHLWFSGTTPSNSPQNGFSPIKITDVPHPINNSYVKGSLTRGTLPINFSPLSELTIPACLDLKMKTKQKFNLLV
jgi:hypothetical protein